MEIIFLITFLFQFFSASQSATVMVVVGGVSHWENPTVHVGDSVILKHKYEYNLYIFQNKKAFNLCNFNQASLLIKSSSTSYEWHPSRTGFFYFTFNNTCLVSQKLSIKVTPAQNDTSSSPELPPSGAPAPKSGGSVVSPSSPVYPWPFKPRRAVSLAPSTSSQVAVPALEPDKGGSGIPFISSNPAVPLPTGEVDSTIIRPLPTSQSYHGRKAMVEVLPAPMALFSMVFLAL